MKAKTNLGAYNNNLFRPGGNALIRLLWYFVNALFIKSYWIPSSTVRVFLLRLFGAEIGKKVNIKPGVNIKYPWQLQVGDHCWIGEAVWIDNLTSVRIGAHSCISQGAYLLTGNHNFKKAGFDLLVKPIVLEEGVWVGAKSVVCPGAVLRSHAVLAAGSVAIGELKPYSVYQGNPATFKRERDIET